MLQKAINRLLTGPTALGIDISNGRINLALLGQTRTRIMLMGSAQAPVPQGVIANGDVKDYAALTKAVRDLMKKNKINSGKIAISLVAQPSLVQIMNIPKQGPVNTRKYLQNELKHCPLLPGKNVFFDYCGIPPLGAKKENRAFVVAAEHKKVNDMGMALAKVRINIEAIEPASIAAARAIYASKIDKEFDNNILLCTFSDNILNMCVFRHGGLDFIRSRDIGSASLDSPESIASFTDEVNAIAEFYRAEVSESSCKWEVIVSLEQTSQSDSHLLEKLQFMLKDFMITLNTPQNRLEGTQIASEKKASDVSLAAIGLALKLLTTTGPKVKIDLLPAQVLEVNSTKKLVLVAANIVTTLILIMILAIGMTNVKVHKTELALKELANDKSSNETQALIKEREKIARLAQFHNQKLDSINAVVPQSKEPDWSEMLIEIRHRTPQFLRIAELVCEEKAKLMLFGQALSYEDVYRFVEALGGSPLIESATLVGTEKDSKYTNTVLYSIELALKGSQS
ncbi:MAG: pilus assembly protein PilM [Planctomycetota bacterium]